MSERHEWLVARYVSLLDAAVKSGDHGHYRDAFELQTRAKELYEHIAYALGGVELRQRLLDAEEQHFGPRGGRRK